MERIDEMKNVSQIRIRTRSGAAAWRGCRPAHWSPDKTRALRAHLKRTFASLTK
jgi:hypothetical protein